jgi:hypothetical protein
MWNWEVILKAWNPEVLRIMGEKQCMDRLGDKHGNNYSFHIFISLYMALVLIDTDT